MLLEIVLRIAGLSVMAGGVVLVAVFYTTHLGLAIGAVLFVTGTGLLRLSEARHGR